MKSYPVVRSLSGLAGVCLAACSSVACTASNGALFDEEPESMMADEPSELEPSSPSPSETPAPDDATTNAPVGTGSASSEETPSDDDLPLTGGFPTSPVNGKPEPAVSGPAAPEPDGPVVVTVSPSDGAVGVGNDENIVIVFSAPMDREATEAAYQSESIPSSSVSFVWNDAGTELTIVPDAPLAYPAGEDPSEVPARRVSFFISASATDLEGRGLPSAFEASFSLLRRVSFSLFALQDRNLSGSFRSNDTYGNGECARGEINMCVGDQRVNGNNEQYKGFISFELTELPEEARSVEAELTLEITGMSGNPFGGLGGLVLEHASFDVIGSEAFGAEALEEMGLIAEGGGTGTIVSADVASAFMADRRERTMTQYRLRFEDDTDGDNNADAIRSAWDTQTIAVSYLIP